MTALRPLTGLVGLIILLVIAGASENRREASSASSLPNSPPVAVDDFYTVHGATPIGSFLVNDSDPDGDSISFHDVVTSPAHGTLGGFPQPGFYTPQQGYVGPDSFTYRIRDDFMNVINCGHGHAKRGKSVTRGDSGLLHRARVNYDDIFERIAGERFRF